jgi:hypothetical protein
MSHCKSAYAQPSFHALIKYTTDLGYAVSSIHVVSFILPATLALILGHLYSARNTLDCCSDK